MLRQLKPTRQHSSEPLRQWFTSSTLDLIVWTGPGGEITGFQLCYGKGRDEHALTWLEDRGFSHDRIDDGEGNPDKQKMTPLLVPDGTFDKDKLVALFGQQSAGLDSELTRFVSNKLSEYPDSSG